MTNFKRRIAGLALLCVAPVGILHAMQGPLAMEREPRVANPVRNDPRPEVVGRPASRSRVWPEAPEVPRIAFLSTIASERDVGKQLSGLAKIRALLEGTKENVVPVQRPYDVVSGLDRRVYVTDGVRNQVMVFDPVTHAAKPLGESGPGRLVKPMGLGSDRKGNVYVADPGSKRAVAFTPGGDFLRSYGSAEILLNPVDVAVDNAAGIVYVVDSYLHQVLAFRQQDGTLIRRIGRDSGTVSAKQKSQASDVRTHGRAAGVLPAGALPAGAGAAAGPGHASTSSSEPSDLVANRGVGPGEFRYPSFVAVAPNGTLYVTDVLNSRVQAFDRNGRFVRQFGELGDSPGTFARPKGIAVDSEGHVYVADAVFNNVQIFDDEGRLLLAFGQGGHGEGDLDLPLGLSIDRNDRIYVADRTNNRLQIFEYLRGAGATATARLRP